MSDTDEQALLDAEGLGDLARLLAAALDDRAKAAAAGAAAHVAAEEAARQSKAQLAAFDELLAAFQQSPPPEGEAVPCLLNLRRARREELLLHEAEAEARLALLECRRRLLKARHRAVSLIDSLDATPLLDYALANRRAEEAPAAPAPAPAEGDVPYHAEPVTLTPEGAAVVDVASDPDAPDAPGHAKRGRKRKATRSVFDVPSPLGGTQT